MCLFVLRVDSRRYGKYMGPANPLPSYYIERTPPVAKFVRWAAPALPRGDDPPADDPDGWAYWLLLSVLGSPGSGKSVMLRQLEAALNQLPPGERPFVFPILNLTEVVDGDRLQVWVRQATATVVDFTVPTAVSQPGPLGDAVALLCNECGVYRQVLLVDGFEEAPVSWRQRIEEFLARVLGAESVRIVLSMRDNMKLEENWLRQKGESIRLEPLPTPEEQIERRLALAGQVAVSWAREKWEDDLDTQIAGLTAAQRKIVIEELRNNLTPHPYINLLLLREMLKHLGSPLSGADCDASLDAYLGRAGLTSEAIHKAIDLARKADEEGLLDLSAEQNSPEAGQLSDVGIIFIRKNPVAYQLDSGVLALVRLRERLP